MVLTIIVIGIAVALACLTAFFWPVIAVYQGRCWKCLGKGTILERGQAIPFDELSSRDKAEYLCEGTHFYKALNKTCPHCNGTGLR